MKQLKPNTKKFQNGITLIALVITIIVLLILAGVSIATLTGENGILTRAQDAKINTGIAEEREMVELSAQASLIDNDGKEILEQYLDPELENNFGENKYSLEKGENNGEQGFIVTITDTGRRYFISTSGKVDQMIPGPKVSHTISPDTQVNEGEKITITINAEATEGEITKITKPDGTSVENTTTTTYEVEDNGEYKFVVEQSNGGKTTYTVEITNGKYVEKFSDIYNSTQQYTKNGQTAWIPEGFAVGTSDTINSIENGLVITDAIDENHNSTGNEFVWIPVGDINEMAQCSTAGGNCNLQLENDQIVCKTHSNNTKIVGKLYATTTGNSFNANTPNTTYTENSGLREPDTVSSLDNNSTYLNIIKGILTSNTAEYADITAFKNTMQNDYNTMIKSIEKYGGFYIGRYEMSKSSSNTAQSKKNSTALSPVTSSANRWYGLYAYGKTYNTSSVESSMVWGSQYDAMMRWMQENGENVTSANDAIKNTNSTITGPEGDKDVIKNVYDLYGGRLEWTLEANNTSTRVLKGRLLQPQQFTELP